MKVLALIGGLACLASASSDLKLFEKLRSIPEAWHKVGEPKASSSMRFRIAVKSVSSTYEAESARSKANSAF